MSYQATYLAEETYPVHMRSYIAQLNEAERRRAAMTPYMRTNQDNSRYCVRSIVHDPNRTRPEVAVPEQTSVNPSTSTNNQLPKPPFSLDPNGRYPLKPQNVVTAEQYAAMRAAATSVNTGSDSTFNSTFQIAGPSNVVVADAQSGPQQFFLSPSVPSQSAMSNFSAFGQPETESASSQQVTPQVDNEVASMSTSKEDVEHGAPPHDVSQHSRPRSLDIEDEPDVKRRKLLYVAQTVQALARANAAITRAYRNVYHPTMASMARIAADLEMSNASEEDDDIGIELSSGATIAETEEDIHRILAQMTVPVVDDAEWNTCEGPPSELADAIRAIYPHEDEHSVIPFIHGSDESTKDVEMRAIEAIQKFQVQVHRLLDRNFLARHPPGAHLLPMHCIFISTMRSVFPVFLIHPDLLNESQNRVMDEISERRIFILKKLSDAKAVEEKDLTDNCVICQAEFEKEQNMRALRCGHKFHVVCIDNWCRTSLTCPVCRRGVDGHVIGEEEAIPVRAPLATLRSLEFIRTYLVMRRYSYNNHSEPSCSTTPEA